MPMMCEELQGPHHALVSSWDQLARCDDHNIKRQRVRLVRCLGWEASSLTDEIDYPLPY